MDGLLGSRLLHGSTEVATSSLLPVGVVGVYFSAHWCPPCKEYTPELIKAYKRAKAKGKSFEVVFVSGDRDEASFKEYFGSMPWHAVPFADRVRQQVLSNTFQVKGIPTLVLLNGQGGLLDANARAKAVHPGFLATLPRCIDIKHLGWVPTGTVNIIVRHRGQEHEVECEPDEGWEMLRMQIFSVTEVPEDQQRLFGLGVPCGPLDESIPLSRAVAQGMLAQRGSGLRAAGVPESARTASSSYNDDALGQGHHRGCIGSPCGWVAKPDDKAKWYQLDLGTPRSVAGVLLATRADCGQWVSELHLSSATSAEGPWTPVDGGREFRGCEMFPQDPVRVLAASPFTARFVRIEPVRFHKHAALQADVLLAEEPGVDAAPEIVLLSNASADDPFEFRKSVPSGPAAQMLEEQHLAMLQAKLSSLPPRLHGEVRGLEGARKYEDRTLQRQALDDIPVACLDRLVRESPEPKEGYDVAFMRKVLLWFKHGFFSWTNTPSCEHCGSSDTRNVGNTAATRLEQQFGAGTVEVAQCGTCGLQTRFPRYNDPSMLLEWRQGRCGEWANCFTLVCRALGYEARHVHDWTDHVWTEVYCDSVQRWLHADSCEQALDTPLVYEQGWGKKLNYCLAFARDHALDVTCRYTRKFNEVLTRRNQFSEQQLKQALSAINEFATERSLTEYPEAVAGRRRTALEQRGAREAEELATIAAAAPKAEEQVGRTSGDAQWREQRGELGANEEAKAKALRLSDQGVASLGSAQPASVQLDKAELLNVLLARFAELQGKGVAADEAAAAAAFAAAALTVRKASVSEVHDNRSEDEWRLLQEVPGDALHSALVSVRWRDQGWGNQKGRLRAALRRGGAVAGEVDLFGVAPHAETGAERRLVDVAGVVPAAGDSLAFEYQVGGGGGHELHISSFDVVWTTTPSSPSTPSAEAQGRLKAKFAEHLKAGLAAKAAAAALLAEATAPAAPPAPSSAATPAAAPPAATGDVKASAQAVMKAKFAELVRSGLSPNEAAARLVEEMKKVPA